MCTNASLASRASRFRVGWDAWDAAAGTKGVPRRWSLEVSDTSAMTPPYWRSLAYDAACPARSVIVAAALPSRERSWSRAILDDLVLHSLDKVGQLPESINRVRQWQSPRPERPGRSGGRDRRDTYRDCRARRERPLGS